ncbi:MAG: sulfatase-like hydrolase/transferase [Rhodospirillaceae bacterium]|jgi:arylsulfatase A-like enzyme|nr:sulfatase-like hydrolase/transferase [Rhodospirillaceae bacterium]
MTVNQPNILFLVTDQECARPDLPKKLELPAHDRLRDKGTEFLNYHVTTAPCTPSRSVIYSGQHTSKTGIIANTDAPPQREMPLDVKTIGHMMREAGYYTAYKGKWHLGGADLPPRKNPIVMPNTKDALEKYGFSDYSADGDHWGESWDGFRRDGVIASEAADWLANKGPNVAKDQPWLLAVNFINPHDIMFFDATGDMEQKRIHPGLISTLKPAPAGPPYDLDWDVPLPESFEDDLSAKPWAQRNFQLFNDYFFGGPLRDDREAWQRFRSYYFNCIRDVDRHLGTVLDALDQSGQADNTIIIYTSDHGEIAGAHGMTQKGPMMYKENLRVPFTVVHPDIAGGQTTDALGSALDVAPTLLSLAGLDKDQIAASFPDLKGVDLTPTLQSNSSTERQERGILMYFGVLMLSFDADAARKFLLDRLAPPKGPPPPPPPKVWDQPTQPLGDPALFRGIHTGRYKFARYFKPSEHHRPDDWETLIAHNELELYDLEADPEEMNNLASGGDVDKDLLLALNAQLNDLIELEIGVDDGHEFPGDPALYQL